MAEGFIWDEEEKTLKPIEEMQKKIKTRKEAEEKQAKIKELDVLIELFVRNYDIKVDLRTGNITITRKKKAE